MIEQPSEQLRFPYVRFPVSDPFTKRQSVVYRPVIPVILHSRKMALTCQALIDSGADECIFSGEVAFALGFPLLQGKPRVFAGIGGSVIGYLHPTTLHLGRVRFACPIYYSDEWNHLRFGLLGQVGFLSHFGISLDYRAKQITFTPQLSR